MLRKFGAVGFFLACGTVLIAQQPYWERVTTFTATGAFFTQADGKIFTVGGGAISRLNADGSRDAAFSAALNPAETVEAIATQPGGKILVVGGFPQGAEAQRIIRLNADGTRDATFRAVSSDDYSAGFAAGPDGYFYGVPSRSLPPVQRFTPDGAVDSTFRAPPIASIATLIAPVTDGSVFVAPINGSISPGRGPMLIRLLRDGTVDTGFVPDSRHFPFREVLAITPLPDGRVFVVGRQGPVPDNVIPSLSYLRLLRLTRTGEVDFAYYTPINTHSVGPRDDFKIAGVLHDLLRETGASSTARTGATLYAFTPVHWRTEMLVSSDGQLLLSSSDLPPARYVRTAAPAPSFDPAPKIITQPIILSGGPVGSTRSTTAQPGGLFPLGLQWQRDGVDVPGATSATIILLNAAASTAGNYTLVVTNPYGSSISSPAPLAFAPNWTAVVIARQPADQTVIAGQTATISVEATATPTATFQWSFNGINLPGATNATLNVPAVQLSQAGGYTVGITSRLGGSSASVTSRPAVLTVLNPTTDIYRGRVGATGEFALAVRADRTAMLVMSVGGNERMIIAPSLRLESNGTFSGSGRETTAGSADVTNRNVQGTIAVNGNVTGTVSGVGLDFTGTRSGGDDRHAGYYPAAAIAAANADAHVVVMADRSVFVASQGGADHDSGTGAVDGAGRLEATLFSGAKFSATIDAASGAVTATVDRGVFAGRTFAGLRDGASRTSRLVNLATRGFVGPGGNALAAGFVVTGGGSRALLFRAVGPTLGAFGISGALPDPSLALYQRGDLQVIADDWPLEIGAPQIVTTSARVGAFALPASRDAALSRGVSAGNYTMEITGNNDASGVALVEVYEDEITNITPTSARLTNLSTRALVGTGESILVAGFVIKGNAPQRVLIRGAGPALATLGVTGTLADPVLTILDAAGTPLLANDDWGAPAVNTVALISAQAAVGAFPFAAGSRDAAILVTLQPGAYTAQLSGKNNTSGIALTEIYAVP